MSTRTGSEIASAVFGERTRFHEVRRYRPAAEADNRRDGASPVLLIHAATLGSRMFLAPDGGFVRYLLGEAKANGEPAFDVYTLDWRSSNLIFGPWGKGGPEAPPQALPEPPPEAYRIDRVAEDDIPKAMATIAGHHPKTPIHVVAHCMGAAATAQALASGAIGGARGQPPLGHVVLATVGLFYRLGVDGFLKVSDNVMRTLEDQGVRSVSPHFAVEPREPWPKAFEDMFTAWKESFLPHGCGDAFCDRLWFLFGGDFRSVDMQTLHDGHLPEHFGAMPVGLYRHIVDNCQRGFAARWDHGPSLLNPEPFKGRRMTLISGNENQVWHRDSIDRMFEWLHRELGSGAAGIRKRIFDSYGHVDLWWSSRAPGEVFPYIAEGLRGT